MRSEAMNTRALVAFILSLLGGLGMLGHGSMMYGRFGRNMSRWGGHHHHLLWERSMAGHFGLWWPWIGVIVGSVVVVSAICYYLAPQYRRTLGMTILVASLINLFFGMSGMFASFFGIAGAVIILSPAPASEQ